MDRDHIASLVADAEVSGLVRFDGIGIARDGGFGGPGLITVDLFSTIVKVFSANESLGYGYKIGITEVFGPISVSQASSLAEQVDVLG